MYGTMWFLKEIFTFRVELTILCAEVVMDWCAFEDTLLYTFAFS